MNAVRVHLQLGRFMPDSPTFDEHALLKLDQLVGLARRLGLVLDVTGLAHYREEAIPAWFRALDDEEMMAVEAAFWKTIGARYPDEPTIFCYDLQNEPLVAFEDRPGQVVGKRVDDLRWAFTNFHFQHLGRYWREWVHDHVGDERSLRSRWPEYPLSGESWNAPEMPKLPFGGGEQRWEDFIAFIHDLALRWTRRMTAAVRANDSEHLLTVGLVPWSVPFHPTLYSGFSPHLLRGVVDFISIHVYPGHPESTLEEAKMTLRAAYVGLPVVLEETQAYLPSVREQREYYRWTLSSASGWIGFQVPRWLTPDPEDLHKTVVNRRLYATYRDFVTREVPRTNVRRVGTRSITVRVADARSPRTTPRWKFWAAPEGPALQKRVRQQFHALDAVGEPVDIILE